MKLRNIVGGIIGGMGAIAGINHLLGKRAARLGTPLSRELGRYRWRGMNIAYTEGGDPEAQDMVLLHGVHRAGSSREFRRVFDHLTEDYHVLAPDLPGFGRSDRPPLTYSARMYQSFVRDFMTDIADTPICIASSLTASFAVKAADEVSIEQLLLICPTEEPHGGHRSILGRLLRLPIIGTAGFNVLTSRIGMRRMLNRQVVLDPNTVDKDDMAYFWQSAHQPGARNAPASLVAGHLTVKEDLGSAIAELSIPTTLVWGRDVTSPPVTTGRDLADRSGSKLVVIDKAGIWPHYEQADSFLSLLEDEIVVTSTD